MNPLLFVYRICHSSLCPLNSFACRAIVSSSVITTDSDSTMSRTTSSWAFEYLTASTAKLASSLYLVSSSWLLLPMLIRMQESKLSIHSPSTLSYGKSNQRTRCDAVDSRTKSDLSDNRVSVSSFRTPVNNLVGSSTSITPTSSHSLSTRLDDEPILPSVTQTLPHLYGKNSERTDRYPDELISQSHIQQLPSKRQQGNFPSSLRRVNSNEWVKDYKKERIDKINYYNVFGGTGDVACNEIPVLLPQNYPLHGESSDESTLRYSLDRSSSSSTSSVSEMSKFAVISTDDLSSMDVICGRGGKANSHPGNVSFRAEALKLRKWYESSSKSEKFSISALLVDFVRERGGRFLKRDEERPGHWLEADGNEVRKKASQTLREGKLRDLASKASVSKVGWKR